MSPSPGLGPHLPAPCTDQGAGNTPGAPPRPGNGEHTPLNQHLGAALSLSVSCLSPPSRTNTSLRPYETHSLGDATRPWVAHLVPDAQARKMAPNLATRWPLLVHSPVSSHGEMGKRVSTARWPCTGRPRSPRASSAVRHGFAPRPALPSPIATVPPRHRTHPPPGQEDEPSALPVDFAADFPQRLSRGEMNPVCLWEGTVI